MRISEIPDIWVTQFYKPKNPGWEEVVFFPDCYHINDVNFKEIIKCF